MSIALYYPENLKGSKNEKTSALLSQGGAEKSKKEEKNYILDSKHKFVSKMMAPREGFEPPTNWLTANCSTTELPRNDYL